MIALLGSIVGIYEKYFDLKEPDIAQNSLMIRSIKNILSFASKDINNSSDLQNIFGDYPIYSKDGEFLASIKVKPVFDKLNINLYLKNGKINEDIDRFFDNLLEFYEVADPIFFKDILLDTIDKDSNEREGFSEIINENPEFLNGKIYNQRHFDRILDYYSQKREDKNIYNIPWDELIYFGDEKKYLIECNLMSEKLARFLGLNFETTLDCSSLKDFSENNHILQSLDIIPYQKGKDFWIAVDVDYRKNKYTEKFSLIYNLKNDKVVKIESYTLY